MRSTSVCPGLRVDGERFDTQSGGSLLHLFQPLPYSIARCIEEDVGKVVTDAIEETAESVRTDE